MGSDKNKPPRDLQWEAMQRLMERLDPSFAQ